jgi:hypothetical protein
MVSKDRVREVWLTLWGIGIALLIQVIYDQFGVSLKFVGGLAITVAILVPLFIFSKFYFDKKPDNSSINQEEFQKRVFSEFDRIDAFLMHLPKETEPEKASDGKKAQGQKHNSRTERTA